MTRRGGQYGGRLMALVTADLAVSFPNASFSYLARLSPDVSHYYRPVNSANGDRLVE